MRSLLLAFTLPGVLTVSALALTLTPDAQPMRLLPSGSVPAVEVASLRVWTGPKAPGSAGMPDRVQWISATGDLRVTIVGHPQRSGLDGQHAVPGDCVMTLTRPDLAGTHLQVRSRDDGPDELLFLRYDSQHVGDVATVLRATVLVSAGCDTSGVE